MNADAKMKTLNELLDRARKACDRDSDRALAERLKVTGQSVMQWRRGTNRITDEHLAKVIDLAHADPALAVLVRQEGAESREERKMWGPLWDRLSPATTAVVGVLLLAGSVLPSPAIGGPLKASYDGGSSSAMHIMLRNGAANILRALAWIV